MLTAYCLSYGNWTVIPKQWSESFADMRDNGYDAVALSFSESEMKYARRTFELQVEEAHKHNLKVIVVFSRIGGRLAGAPYMPSPWLTTHPASQMPEKPDCACVTDPAFREWSNSFIAQVISDYPIDGIIWDEPKSAGMVTKHPSSPFTTQDECCAAFADLIRQWTCTAKAIRPNLNITVFNMPHTLPEFSSRCAAFPEIDYTGFDGGLCLQSFFHEEPWKHKAYLWETWPRTLQECKDGNCGTFALIENMLLPRSQHNELEKNLEMFLQTAHPDHLGCYYYAHNNESPAEAQSLVNKLISKYYLS